MTSIANGSVIIQSTSESVPSTPSWFGEVALMAAYLRRHGVLTKISERVRFARRRFGQYEVIDFLTVLFGSAISGEHTLEAFYERLQPFAVPFMALFERDQLPARSTLSRFLAALSMEPVEALRSLFLDDLFARPLTKEQQRGELLDRTGRQWEVFDIDGTRQTARQRALPKMEELPTAQRRLDEVCAAGYTGRTRGEVVRTRTVVAHAHTSKSARHFRKERQRRVPQGVGTHARSHPSLSHSQRPPSNTCSAAVGRPLWHRGHHRRFGRLLLRDARQRLHDIRPPDRAVAAPPASRCPLQSPGKPSRANALRLPRRRCRTRGLPLSRGSSHPPGSYRRRRAASARPEKAWFTNSFSPISRKRGSLPPILSLCISIVEPLSQCLPMKIRNRRQTDGALIHLQDKKSGRWSHNGCGTCVWNWDISFLLIRCGRPSLLLPSRPPHRTRLLLQAMHLLRWVRAFQQGRFSGQDFAIQPDGTLRCPAGQSLVANERRREADGSLRVVYAASIRSCRLCSLREQCQWQGSATKKPRQVSVLLHPLNIGSAPLLWRDWSRRHHRRACRQLLRSQRVEVQGDQGLSANSGLAPAPFSRAQRAHYRLDFPERFARNARVPTANRVTIRLFGVPEGFASSLGLATA
jgi:hypothetical protein